MARLLNSTRGRLTLVALGVLAVAFCVADIAVYLVLSTIAHDDLDIQLRAEAIAVSRRLDVSGATAVYPDGPLPGETAGGLPIDIAVVGPDGIVLQTPGDGLPATTTTELAAAVAGSGRATSWTDIRDTESVPRHVYALPVTGSPPGRPFVLIASTPTAQVDSAVRRAMVAIVLFSALVLASSGALVFWLVGRVLRPVQQIANVAESLSDHDLHRRVELGTSQDELSELAATFNHMLDRLESSFQALRQFTADASHELRSPLALMAAELDRIATKPRSPAEHEKLNETLRTEVRELADLVERLLLLARADAGELHARVEAIDVADFLHKISVRWSQLAADRGLSLDVVAPAAGIVNADVALTKRILDNLIDNAIKHSPPRGRVRLGARQEGGRWVFEVADQGPGVAPEVRDRVFERFARADTARSRDGRSGAGLGLAVSSVFAAVQGGELRLADAPGGGALFQLWLTDEPQPAEDSAAGRV